MSDTFFDVSSFVVPACHVREYPRGARSPAAALKLRLSVRRYTPRGEHQKPSPNALTIIATHANGFPKETYEPLWDSILQKLPPGTIRGIWIADCAHQNASAALNEGLLGDDPHWFDHARDLLNLVNRFAGDMPLPIVGIGHSMGCAQLLRLSSSHPRLMCGLALIEPVVQSEAPPGPNNALGSSYRPDWWPSHAVAEQSFRKSKFFKDWSSDALQKFLEYGLRNTPTEIYPEEGGITLATSKAQEAWSFIRGHFNEVGSPENERRASPDTDEETRLHLFARPEVLQMNKELPFVRPNVLYIFGERSFINSPLSREDKMKRTGTASNGNGGVAAGNVEQVTIKGGQHMIPMERTEEVASALSRWLERQIKTYIELEHWHREYDRGVSVDGKSILSKKWMENVRHKEDTSRKISVKL